MFTGIVEETGAVERIRPAAKSIELTVRAERVRGRGLKLGGSLAVNGCCLTAVKVSSRGKFKLVAIRSAAGDAGGAPTCNSPSPARLSIWSVRCARTASWAGIS